MRAEIATTLAPDVRAFLRQGSDELIERGYTTRGVLLRKHYGTITYRDRHGIVAAISFELLRTGICYIDLVHVRSDRRGEGLYGKLYRALCRYAKAHGCSSIESCVSGKNTSMIDAATKAGRTVLYLRYSDPL